MDSLCDIPRSALIQLRDLYKSHWPKNHMGYYLLNNYVKWLKNDPDINNFELFCLHGCWEDGTFILVDRNEVFCNTLNNDTERLEKALSLLDWRDVSTLSCYNEKISHSIHKIVNCFPEKLDYKTITSTKWYFLPQNLAKRVKITIPSGFTLKPLLEEHASLVNDAWKYKDQCSEGLIKRIIKYNITVGLFHDDNLIGWIIRFQTGAIGALNVKDSYVTKGFSYTLVKAITKRVADLNEDVLGCASDTNLHLKRIYRKIGFQGFDRVYRMSVLPLLSYELSEE